MTRYLYVAPNGQVGIVADDTLASTTERHRVTLEPPVLGDPLDPEVALRQDPDLAGVVLEMYVGWPGREHLLLARRIMRLGRRVWVYWPREGAAECVTRQRIGSYWRHILAVKIFERTRGPLRMSVEEGVVLATASADPRTAINETAPSAPPPPVSLFVPPSNENALVDPRPMAWNLPPGVIRGHGVYLRLDFWNHFDSGGSYGHTCYVAKELAATTDRFVCFLGQRYRLLDALGVYQVVRDAQSWTASEDDLLIATQYYYQLLKPAFEALRPAYVYERICLGNHAGALLCQELGIPYIVEYNGSEISIQRSFGSGGFVHEDAFTRAEDFAFAQATIISVISSEVKASLVERGVDPNKILVNPNGVDPDTYAPLADERRRQLRGELEFTDQDVVVGFTGTFGGWHGVGVLAAALPRILAAAPQARFLLIGDGAHKHLVDAAIERTPNEHRVRSVG